MQVFADVYAARFPIERMVPVAAYGGDDGASMRANNTSGYNCRTVAGSSSAASTASVTTSSSNPATATRLAPPGAPTPGQWRRSSAMGSRPGGT